MKILAIDLGKFKSVACTYATEIGKAEFATVVTHVVEFDQLLRQQRPNVVVIETCSIAGWVHDLCCSHGIKCQVANPSSEAWKWKNVKRKTDRDDALKLAQLTALGQLPTVYVPAPETRQRRALLKYRQSLITRRVAIQNHLRAIFQRQGILLDRNSRAWTAMGLAAIEQYAAPLEQCAPHELWRGEVALELEALKDVSELLREVERKLDAFAATDASVKLLRTIPGVGRCTAEVVVAYLDDPQRFKNGRQVSAYAGLVPKQFQSGETDRRGRISRRGPSLLRKMLVEAGWLLLRYNAWAQQLVQRLSRGQKTRRKQAIVALARKLLVRCWAMLRDGEPWREPPPITAPA
ncbi:MAG: IS110 family RNA-guided transposase [Planctomycetota bacterium]|jgi:transposase